MSGALNGLLAIVSLAIAAVCFWFYRQNANGLLIAAAIVFGTELRFFQRILDTEELTGNQWLICIGAALAVVAVSEVWKLVLRRREATAEPEAAAVPDDETAPAPA